MSLKRAGLPILGLLLLVTIGYSEYLVAPHPSPGPIHISYWEKWTDFEGKAMQDVVDEFNRKQNRIHVDLLTVSNIQDKTLLAVAGGDPPDVAGLYGPNVAEYADNNAIISLDDLCRSHGIERSNYVSVYWDMGSYNGHQYALPSVPGSTALHYNKAMFAAAGLDPEKPPQTLEEMDIDSDRLTKRDANGHITQSGFLPAEPGWWNWAWGYFFGGKLWDGKGHLTANSEENIRAFEWVQSYSDKYGAAALDSFHSGLGTFSSPQNAFLSNKVAMELQGVWMYNFIDKFAPDLERPKLNWAAVPFPHPANRPDLADSTIADEDILVIPTGAKHPKEAFEFIAYVESQEGMEKLCLGQRKQSALRVVSLGFYRNHPNPYIRVFADLPQGKNVILPPKLAIWPEYQDELSNAFQDIALKRKTAREALNYVQARMEPKFEEYQERLRLRQAAEAKAAKTGQISGSSPRPVYAAPEVLADPATGPEGVR